MIHLPTDSGKMKEAAEASWKGFKPGRPYVTCLTSARGLSCMTRQGIEARWRTTLPWRATTRPREASGGITKSVLESNDEAQHRQELTTSQHM